jgi:hypothetical protein
MKDIASRKPINKTAAVVVSRGFNYKPDKIVQTNDSDMPIATRTITKKELSNECFVNLTGVRFGRFSVVGVARDLKGCWVVRCDCGTYSTRKSRAIKNEKNIQDRCEHCRHLAHLKRNDQYRRHGKCDDITCF